MEDIPKHFKHLWLNTTLKFVKDDNQIVLDYPEMPIAHVDYLHCIWQHQNIEPGLNPLYTSLKEAMRIFSVKYKFQVTKNLLGDVGQLTIQKIPRTDLQTSKASSGKGTQEKPKSKQLSKTQKYVAATKKIIESVSPPFIKSRFQTILDFLKDKAVGSLTFSDLAPIEASLLQQFLGIYNRKEAFSEFLSPACNDILDKMSVAFKEFDRNAKLEICVVKTDKNTRKREITYLKVPRYTNNTTSKAKLRQNVTERKETAESEDRRNNELQSKTVETYKSNLGKTDTNRNEEANVKKNKPINNNNINKIAAGKENCEKNKSISTIDNTTISNNANGKVTKDKKTINKNNSAVVDNNSKDNSINSKTAIDSEVDNKEYKPLTSNDKETINNINVDSKIKSSSIVSRSIKNTTRDSKGNIQITLSIDTEAKNDDSKGNVVTQDTKKVNSETIDTTEEKSKKKREKANKLDKNDFLKDIDKINEIRNKLPKQSILFTKANEGLTNEEITEKYKFQRSTRKDKLLEAMSTPLKSGKGLRMMQLMGWEGGALGVRGDGLMEPLIPEFKHMSGAGLGHTVDRITRKQERHVIRMEFLDNILNLVEKKLSVTIISYKQELSKKDRRFFNETILMFNKKKNNLGTQQSEIGDKIVSKMADEEILLDITLSKCNKLITLRNLKLTTNNENVSLKKEKDNTEQKEKDNTEQKEKDNTEQKEKDNTEKKEKDIAERKEKNIAKKKEKDVAEKKEKDKAKAIKATCEAQFKDMVLAKVLELLKSEDNSFLLEFDERLSKKSCQFVQKVCGRINQRRRLPVVKGAHIYEKYEKEIVYHTGDSYLALEFGEKLQSVTIRKLKENQMMNEIFASITDNKSKIKDTNNNAEDAKVNVAKKIMKTFIILIKPTNDKQFAKTITNLITDKIEMEDDFLPCLKNHGIQNGFLVYSCANRISCLWLKDVLNDYNVIDYRGTDNKYAVQIKLKAHMDVDKVLALLDKYNNGLDVSKWRVLEGFLVEVDVESFEFICDNNFRLNAGVDEVEFNIHYVT